MKCPCEDCLIIPICINRHPYRPANFVIAIEECSLLRQFLEVTKTYAQNTQFWSSLECGDLDKRLVEVSKFLPHAHKSEKEKFGNV